MSRASAASRPPSRRALTGLAVAALLALAACGGTADDPAETGASTTEAGAPSEDSGTHVHREGEAHAHDGGGHTHAGADTVASGVALDPGPDAGWTGSVTLLSVGDSLRVLVSVEGLAAGARRRAELVAGSCEEPGSELASLTPVAAGSSGEGSSQTTVGPAALEGHGHGAVRLLTEDGSPAACAAVHLPGAGHTHG